MNPPRLTQTFQAALLATAFLSSSYPTFAAPETLAKLKLIDRDALSGDLRRIENSINEYKQLGTTDPEVQWRLLRAYVQYHSELTCRGREKDQEAAAKDGHDFAIKVDAVDSSSAEMVYYYANISTRYYQRRLFKAALSFIFGGFDPFASFEKARQMNKEIDYAGPDRSLGVLYLELPGFRDESKALQHLKTASQLYPTRVANRYWLAKALVKTGHYDEAWPHIAAIRAEDLKVGEDVSSEHWKRLYMRRLEGIRRENIEEFAQLESRDKCDAATYVK